MTYMLETEKWTTGELFLGARNCNRRSYYYRRTLHDDNTYQNDGTSDNAHKDVGWIGHIYIDPQTLQSGCASNVSFCQWNATHDLRQKDGRELFSPSVVNREQLSLNPVDTGLTNYYYVESDNSMNSDYSYNPCTFAFPRYCGWVVAYSLQSHYSSFLICQIKYSAIPEALLKQCEKPREEDIGWGGAGWIHRFQRSHALQGIPGQLHWGFSVDRPLSVPYAIEWLLNASFWRLSRLLTSRPVLFLHADVRYLRSWREVLSTCCDRSLR